MQEKALSNFYYYIFTKVSLAYIHTEIPQSPT